jgi:carbonic anhydrase
LGGRRHYRAASGLDLAANGMAASKECGVKALQVAGIVICGHAYYGAVKGAMSPESVEPLQNVGAWLEHADTGQKHDLDDAIEANVLAQLGHLRTYDFINKAVGPGSLALSGCVYDIASGLVRIFDGTEFVVPTVA